jgi:hypothetical protein
VTKADYPEFCAIIGGFAELRGKELSAPALALYFRAMQDWLIEDFREAALYLLKNCEWMPLPHHFEALRKKGKRTADEAWSIALAACSSWSTSNTCGDAVIDRVVATIGGYQTIAHANVETALPHVQRRFLTAYEEISQATDVRATLTQLPNHDEARALLGHMTDRLDVDATKLLK